MVTLAVIAITIRTLSAICDIWRAFQLFSLMNLPILVADEISSDRQIYIFHQYNNYTLDSYQPTARYVPIILTILPKKKKGFNRSHWSTVCLPLSVYTIIVDIIPLSDRTY
jgi:hypothetical protein